MIASTTTISITLVTVILAAGSNQVPNSFQENASSLTGRRLIKSDQQLLANTAISAITARPACQSNEKSPCTITMPTFHVRYK